MHRRYGYAGSHLNLFKAEPFPSHAAQFGHYLLRQCSMTSCLATARLPSLDALRKPLLLGNGGQQADNGFTEHPRAVEVLLCEGFELHASCCALLQVVERFGHAFAAEAVEALE